MMIMIGAAAKSSHPGMHLQTAMEVLRPQMENVAAMGLGSRAKMAVVRKRSLQEHAHHP